MTTGNAIDFGDLKSMEEVIWRWFKWSWRFRIMSELRINNITDRAGSSGTIIAGVSTVTSTSHMVMPSGPTEMRGGRGRAILVVWSTIHLYVNTMDFVEIATTGNATDFGDLSKCSNIKTGFGGMCISNSWSFSRRMFTKDSN